MSAPDTNLDRQKARHRSALIGMIAVVAFALALFFGLSAWLGDEGQTPGENSPAITAPMNG